MTIELTDEDRAAIEDEFRKWWPHRVDSAGYCETDIYIAGLRAGMERAARICEAPFGVRNVGGTADGVASFQRCCDRCAAAIREATK